MVPISKLATAGLTLALLAGGIAMAPATLAQDTATETESAPAGAPTLDSVIARVNGTELTMRDLVAAQRSLPEQFRELPLEMIFQPLLDRVVDGQLLLEEAERRDLASDPEVQQALARARAAVLRERLVQKVIDEGSTEEALRAAYEERRAEPDFRFEEIHARHILVETEDEAKALIAELEAGADFAELAKEHSTGPSGPEGGDLGYFRQGAMVPEFDQAVFAMEPGSFSAEPVQTQFGWHVIKVEDRRESEPSFEEVEGELRQQLAQSLIADLVEKTREGATIERFNPDGTPMEDDAGTPEDDAPAEGDEAPAAQ